ncbi:hypothetical protein O1R50_07400 [Glycomyces luteolus]|uniref:LPXTG cell wall anchor domain-containing protein n=1 Tax=Glycomyces luteolus TaxID=2670330 RepID=A0A9X3T315_9ACTN|nr:hypothetical protein [Glycomyces luteolus]MDA1359440.1 hypothetical protein [Glycomyces luteolus]
MELKQSLAPRKGLRLAVALGLLGALALGSPAQAADLTVPINEDHVGKPATYFEEGCGSDSQLPDDLGADEDGWVFVLPGGNDIFISVSVTFLDEDGGEHAEEGTVVTTGGSGNLKHAYIITPAGWTIKEASAVIEGDSKFFNVTHTCPGTPGEEEPSSPGEEPSSPGEEPSPPGEESSTPGEASTSPAGSNLPVTGTPLTIALVSAAALAAGGAALYMIQRRRREAQDW